MNTYNWSIDSNDAATWLGTFTDDGVFESPIVGHNQGQAELAQCYSRMWSAERLLTYTGGWHRIANLLLGEDNDAVHARSQFILVMPSANGAEITVTGQYLDELREQDGAWRFARRQIKPYPLPDWAVTDAKSDGNVADGAAQ